MTVLRQAVFKVETEALKAWRTEAYYKYVEIVRMQYKQRFYGKLYSSGDRGGSEEPTQLDWLVGSCIQDGDRGAQALANGGVL